jgi:uncharacterized protein (TIGR03067 family)
MKQLIGLFLGVVLLNSSLGGESDLNKNDLKRLQGKWQLVTYVQDGKPGETGNVWQVSGNKISYLPDSSIYSFLKLDATKRPKRLDFDLIIKEPYKIEKGFSGIYEFDGDTVKFCVARPGKERPQTFESTPGSGHIFAVLKQVKSKE